MVMTFFKVFRNHYATCYKLFIYNLYQFFHVCLFIFHIVFLPFDLLIIYCYAV